MNTLEGVMFCSSLWVIGPNRRNGKFLVYKIPLNADLVYEELIAHAWVIVVSFENRCVFQNGNIHLIM